MMRKENYLFYYHLMFALEIYISTLFSAHVYTVLGSTHNVYYPFERRCCLWASLEAVMAAMAAMVAMAMVVADSAVVSP
jgi:hypothetical protein